MYKRDLAAMEGLDFLNRGEPKRIAIECVEPSCTRLLYRNEGKGGQKWLCSKHEVSFKKKSLAIRNALQELIEESTKPGITVKTREKLDADINYLEQLAKIWRNPGSRS